MLRDINPKLAAFAEQTLQSLAIAPTANPRLALRLQEKIDQKTKPLGALGALETLALQMGLIQNSLTVSLDQPTLYVVAADHGAAASGVSAYPASVTWQMVQNFLAGGAAVNVFARHNGLALKIIDAGVAHDFAAHEQLIDCKIARGSANYLHQAALSGEQCQLAFAHGERLIEQLVQNGCRILALGEMGIGNSASAALLTHVFTGAPLAQCVGRGTGLDDAGLIHKQQCLALAMERVQRAHGKLSPTNSTNHTTPAETLTLLCEVGGLEIALMAALMLYAAKARLVVLVDGYIVGSAALLACRFCPALRDYLLFCHRSAEPGHVHQLAALNATPLLDLGLRLGEGSGTALAWPLVNAAAQFLNEMASFSSAQVSAKNSAPLGQ